MHLAVKPKPWEILGLAMVGDAVIHTLSGEALAPAGSQEGTPRSLPERAARYLSHHSLARRLYIATEFAVGWRLATSARKPSHPGRSASEETAA